MEYVIAVYRSRNVSMRVYNYLLSQQVMCALVSTPRSVNVGCGLSVKMRRDVYEIYRSLLRTAETFVGFYLVKQGFGGQSLVML